MVETTRTPFVPYSFGDLMEGRLRKVGDPEASPAQRNSTARSNSAADAASSSAGGRGTGSTDFQRDFRDALQDSSGGRTATPPASTASNGASTAASTDTEKDLRNKLAKIVGASANNVSIQEMPSQDTGRTTGTRQYIVTVDPPGSGGPAESIGVNHTLSLPLAEDAADFDYDAISMVKDRLNKLGISSSGIQFEYWTDHINNIGGNRSFHYLSADLGNGIKENFSLEWTLYNPDVTAVEIARLMKYGNGAAASSIS